jgi:VanZ family protein
MGITLSAGLWPFSFHIKNQVWWKPEQAGLYIGSHGMLVSEKKFPEMSTDDAIGSSIELWLEPALTYDSSTILSFYDSQSGGRMQLMQSGDDLAYVGAFGPGNNRLKQRIIYLDNAFQEQKNAQITLTSKNDRLEMYSNGVLKKSVNNLGMRGADLAGTMIVGNTPYGNLSWTGTIRGLAIYDRALDAEQIKHDYRSWQQNRESMTHQPDPPYSLYLFDEQTGDRVHNAGKTGPDLIIPKNYFILQPGFLVPFWREFRPTREYVNDLAINIFGLVPLGFCYAALFAWLIGRERSLLYTTLLGFCVSLTIEVLQAYMPTRFSGTTDLITNTLGAALGGWLYLNHYFQDRLKSLGFVRTG